jgi:hypothetical protein
MRLFYLIKIMVRKVYCDEIGNELELFINEEKKLVISIKNENRFIHVFLDEYDVSELINEMTDLTSNL